LEEKEVVITMMEELLPRSKYLHTGNNSFGADWETGWANDQRICSDDYFHKYFVYAVENGQISDVEFNSLMGTIEHETIENTTNRIINMTNSRGFPKIIKKFRMIEQKMTITAAAKLVICLSKLGERMPNNDGFLGIQTTMGQAAILIAQLIKLQTKVEQLSIAKNAINYSTSLKFSMEIFRWVRPNENREDNLFSEEEVKIIAEDLITKIKEEVKKGNFLVNHKEEAYSLLWIWKNWGSSEEVRTAILKWLSEEDGAEKFLSIFVGQAYDMATGIPTFSSFEVGQYECVQNFISPTDIADVLLKKYKLPNSKEDYYKAEDMSIFQKIAIQFLWIYKEKNNLKES
jgi:hypothetical protein